MKYIDEVLNGLACECYCVDCNEALVAKNGGKEDRLKHFAHTANTACEGESALHFAAKQMLEEFREEGLFLPRVKHLVSYIDPLGCTYENLIDKQLNKLTAYSVKLEQRVDNIIADALIELSGEQLAVEIFYRHKKSEQDVTKFKVNQLSVIEIDISMLGPSTSPSELKQSVLKGADRAWLFNRKKEILIQKTYQKLQDESRSSLKKRLALARELASNWLQQAVGRQSIPSIEEVLIGSQNKVVPAPTLVVTSIVTNLIRLEGKPIFKATLQVNNKTNVPIFFVPNSSEKYSLAREVHLIYCYSSSQDNIQLDELFWVNVELWKPRYMDYVDKAEQLRLESIQNFASKFQSLSNDMKFLDMSKRLGVESGEISTEQKRFNYYWNAPNYVWQSIVLNYFLKKHESIDCGLLAENDWLRQLMDFKLTEKAIKGRSKSIYFWLKKHLAPMDIAFHCYGLQWRIRNEFFTEKSREIKLSKFISD